MEYKQILQKLISYGEPIKVCKASYDFNKIGLPATTRCVFFNKNDIIEHEIKKSNLTKKFLNDLCEEVKQYKGSANIVRYRTNQIDTILRQMDEEFLGK